MTILSKRPWEESVRKLSLFITIKICSASDIFCCCTLNWYLLVVEMNLGHAHETRFWYLLGVFSKFSDEHPVTSIVETPHPPSPPPPTPASNVTHIWLAFSLGCTNAQFQDVLNKVVLHEKIATTIFRATMMEQCCNNSKQCCNNAANALLRSKSFVANLSMWHRLKAAKSCWCL